MISTAGAVLLTQTARICGLDRHLSTSMRSWRGPRAIHDPGKVLLDLAIAVALGGDCAADIAVLRAQPEVFGLVASDPTVSRAIDTFAVADTEVLTAIRAARAVARAWVWQQAGAPTQDGWIVLDPDATLLISHSEKEDATKTWKKTFGFHPLLVFCDHGENGTGEPVAGLLRRGNAGSVRHEVAQVSGYTDWRFDGCRRCSPGQCPRPVPALTCVAGNGGVRSSEKKPKGFRSVRKPQARGRPDG
jgi:hypothetical protein